VVVSEERLREPAKSGLRAAPPALGDRSDLDLDSAVEPGAAAPERDEDGRQGVGRAAAQRVLELAVALVREEVVAQLKLAGPRVRVGRRLEDLGRSRFERAVGVLRVELTLQHRAQLRRHLAAHEDRPGVPVVDEGHRSTVRVSLVEAREDGVHVKRTAIMVRRRGEGQQHWSSVPVNVSVRLCTGFPPRGRLPRKPTGRVLRPRVPRRTVPIRRSHGRSLPGPARTSGVHRHRRSEARRGLAMGGEGRTFGDAAQPRRGAAAGADATTDFAPPSRPSHAGTFGISATGRWW
jgi:hypothetical protein